MKSVLLALLIPVAMVTAILASSAGNPTTAPKKTPPHCRYCTPSEDGTCTACKNCKYCGHCNASSGNTCSVCN